MQLFLTVGSTKSHKLAGSWSLTSLVEVPELEEDTVVGVAGSNERGWCTSPTGARRLSCQACSPSRPASCGLQEWAAWTVLTMAAAVELGTVGMSSSCCCWFELFWDEDDTPAAAEAPEWLKLRVKPVGWLVGAFKSGGDEGGVINIPKEQEKKAKQDIRVSKQILGEIKKRGAKSYLLPKRPTVGKLVRWSQNPCHRPGRSRRDNEYAPGR